MANPTPARHQPGDERTGRRMPRPGIPLGQVFGVPVFLHSSWLLLALFVIFGYGQVARVQLGLSSSAGYVVGLGFALLLVLSILLHELGHAITARRFGMRVRGIVLELLGGYTELEGDTPRPAVELLVALAGPAVSLVVGSVAAGAAALLPDNTAGGQVAFQVAAANILVAVFNVLPGLPLDGGRALRAGVWAASDDRHLGTRVAGWIGRVVALATLALAVLLYSYQLLMVFGFIFLLVISLTLWQGASHAIRMGRIGARFPLIDLARLARPVFTVVSGTPLAEAERRAAEAGQAADVLGVSDSSGRLVALVHPQAAQAVPAERRPWVSVDSVARDIAMLGTIPIELRGEAVIRAVQAHPGSEYLVTSGDDVVGVLRLTDLAQLLEPRQRTAS